jgi:hypothetical protein
MLFRVNKCWVVIAASLFCLAGCQTTASEPLNATAVQAPAANDDEKLSETQGETQKTAAAGEQEICKTKKTTGSRLRKTRVCMTAEEWEYVESEMARGVRDLQDDKSRYTLPNQ